MTLSTPKRPMRDYKPRDDAAIRQMLATATGRASKRGPDPHSVDNEMRQTVDDDNWAMGHYFVLRSEWQRQLEAIVGRHVSLEAIIPDTDSDAYVRRTGERLWARDGSRFRG